MSKKFTTGRACRARPCPPRLHRPAAQATLAGRPGYTGRRGDLPRYRTGEFTVTMRASRNERRGLADAARDPLGESARPTHWRASGDAGRHLGEHVLALLEHLADLVGGLIDERVEPGQGSACAWPTGRAAASWLPRPSWSPIALVAAVERAHEARAAVACAAVGARRSPLRASTPSGMSREPASGFASKTCRSLRLLRQPSPF